MNGIAKKDFSLDGRLMTNAPYPLFFLIVQKCLLLFQN
jgi:hypothetical protein